MTPTEAIAQLALVLATVEGIREAHYPARALAPKYPGVALLWGETAIAYQSTEQYWSIRVRGLLMTGLVNDTKHHVAEVDPLIARVADAFGAGNFDGFTLRRANGDMVDGCQLTAVAPSSEITYAGQQHYGAELTFSIELRRFA